MLPLQLLIGMKLLSGRGGTKCLNVKVEKVYFVKMQVLSLWSAVEFVLYVGH